MPLQPNKDRYQFEDAREAFLAEARGETRAIILFICIALFFVFWALSSHTVELIFLGLLPPVGWYAYRYSEHKKLFMMQFAAAFDFSYKKRGTLGEEYASAFFTQGHSRQIENVLSGVYQNHPTELFHYQFTTGSGKNSQQHPFTVCIVDFAGTLPDLVLEEKRFLGRDGLTDWHYKPLRLEGPFAEKFRVYTKEDLEIESLEILTPEIMEWLMEKGSTYSFEFKGRRLYLIENGFLTTKTTLANLLVFSSEIVDRLGDRLSRLSDDVDAIKEKYSH